MTTKNKSIVSKLINDGIASEDLLVLVNSISLEDIIALKLELSSRILQNRFYGFDIWRNTNYIVKDALLKFAIANTNSKKDAARFLNLNYSAFSRLIKKFEVDKFYEWCYNQLIILYPAILLKVAPYLSRASKTGGLKKINWD